MMLLAVLHLEQLVVALIATLSLLTTLIAFILVRRWQTRRLLRDFPTVMWRPRFHSYRYGEADKMPSSTITRVLKRMAKLQGPYGCYGTVYGVGTPVIHIAHPIPANAVLHDAPPPPSSKKQRSSMAQSSGARKSPAYNSFHNFFGYGTFTSDGDEWRRKRASVVHCLMRQGNRESEAQRAAQGLVQDLLSQKEPANIVPILQRATLSLIYGYLTHHALLKAPIANYLIAITQIRMITLAKSRTMWYFLPQWCYRWFSGGMYHQEEQILRPIRQFASTALDNAQPGSPLAQLELKTHSHSTPKDLLDEAITLLFAGQDTGAATLSWTLHLLALHPEIQDRLAQEVQDNTNFTKMPYLDAVLKEAMRLYPVAPFVVRHLAQDVVTDKVVLPRNTLCCIWIYSLHRNPEIWKEDPNAFRPERWLKDGGTLTKLQQSAYMPFCSGPRNCLGQPMAHVWLRVLLGTMLQSIEFVDDRLKDNDSTLDVQDLLQDMQAGFTVLPLGGVTLRMVARTIPKN